MVKPSRHTSFGGRADAAPDSTVEVKATDAKETRRLAKAQWWREHRGKASSPPLDKLDKPLDSLDQTRQQTRQILDKPSGTTLDNRLDKLDNDLRALAETSTLLLREVKSLVSRMNAMEAWGQALEERFPRMRVAASPLSGSVTSVPSSVPEPRIIRPGDMVRAPDGRMVKVPVLDADGQKIPE